jgi:hypothetical protein
MHRFSPGFSLLLCLSLLVACGDKPSSGDDDDDDSDDGGDDTADDGDGGGTITDADHDEYGSDVDCDDNDYTVHPGADELCDGIDQDCDGEIDEGFDADGDGHTDAAVCPDGEDCDDANGDIYPGADETPYDGVDDDCDGADLLDVDGDGFDGVGGGGDDCNDENADISPGADDIPKDGIDQDCDGADLLDEDGDGYDDEDFGGDDCDDTDPAISPAAFDWMNDGADMDCDGRDGQALSLIDAEVTIDGAASSQVYVGFAATVCDIDGDSYDDLVLTAPLGGSSYAGQVGIFSGINAASWSASMAMSDADTLIEGSTSYVFLGMSLMCADFDGDGYDDIVTGTGEYAGYSEHSWAVFYGSGGAFSATLTEADADATIIAPIDIPSTLTSVYSRGGQAADLDGDGAAELFFYNSIYEGTDETLSRGDDELWILGGRFWGGDVELTEDLDHFQIAPDQADALTSWAVGPDLNGDGDVELWIGQANYNDEADEPTYYGRASFITGAPTEDGAVADLAFADMRVSDEDRGFGVGAAFGDYDGDGLTDALISATLDAYGGSENAGAVYFYSDIGTSLTGQGLDPVALATAEVQGQYADGYLGSRLLHMGDMNGDGLDDFVVREPGGGSGGTGRVRLVSGAALDGTGLNVDDIELMEWRAEDSEAGTGSTVATGDLDGDGQGDLVITAPTWGAATTGTSTGRVYVYLSGRMGI